MQNLLAGLLAWGALALPASVFGCPSEEFLVVQVASFPGCCYEFNITETWGGDDYISNIVATVNTPGVTFAGADGPSGYPLPTVTPTSITYNVPLHVDPCGHGSPLAVTACFNNIPSTGASISFTANSTASGIPYAFGLGTVTIGTNAECASPSPVQITCGDNITNNCMGDEGALVNFALPAATDTKSNCQPVTVSASWPPLNIPYTTSPVSATFPIGVTPVTITAVDACGNSNTCTFTVTVLGHGASTGDWAFSDGGVASPPAGSSQQGNAIAVDSFGNSFVAGIFTSTATFTGLPPMYSSVNGGNSITLNTAPGTTDAFLAKYDSSGHLLWVQQANGYNAAANGVAVDSQGNCFMTGTFQYSIFPNMCNGSGLTAVGAIDMFLAEYDPQGNLIWAVNGGDVNDLVGVTTGQGVAVDTNDNCYVTGSFQLDAGFGNGNNPCNLLTTVVPNVFGISSDGDAFLAKYDHWGNLLWATNSTCSSVSNNATGRGVAVDANGHVWIVGSFSGGVGTGVKFGSTGPLTTASGRGYACVVQYNAADGTAIWARQTACAGTCGDHDGRGIGVDTNDNCYFTAYFNGDAALGSFTVSDPNPYNGSLSFGILELYDYLVGSLDSNGNPRWLINGGQTNDNESRGLAVTPAGNVYVTGLLGGLSEFGAEGQNVMLHEYSSSGALLWAETGNAMLTLPQVNSGRGVAVDAAGCVYATGGFSDPGTNASTDPGLIFSGFFAPVPLAAPGGLESIFVVKYCSSCSSNSSGCVAPPANLVLWLPFDEKTGTTSGNLASSANPGTQMNGPGVVLNAYVANSLSFDGANQYVTVPDYPDIDIGTNDLTIDAWVNRATNGPNSLPSVILDKRDVNSGVGYSLSVSFGHLILTMSGNNYGDTGSLIVPPDGLWHFVAVSVSQSAGSPQGSFYIDGVLNSAFAPAQANLENTNSFWVGASPLGGNRPWLGDLDEVEVFNRALEASELQGIFSAAQAGKCKPSCYLQTLNINRVGNSVVVTWSGGATLEQAVHVIGPWTPVVGATSPYTVPPPLTTAMFYRLECN
jgi:hypothetical protein